MMEKVLERVKGTGRETANAKSGHKRNGLYDTEKTEGGSCDWIPFASYCTTGQFMKLRNGYIRHCGPTAAVNLIRTLENRVFFRNLPGNSAPGVRQEDRLDMSADRIVEPHSALSRRGAARTDGMSKKETDPAGTGCFSPESADQLFLKCADIGKKMHIYWNTDVLGRFGGTSNFLTGMYLKRCFRAAGLDRKAEIRFHPWITPDAVEKALQQGGIVYLQVYLHPKYKSHHMLCYACRYEKGTEDGTPVRRFLLADGWAPRPVWVSEKEIGHGHYLTVSLRSPLEPVSFGSRE